MGALHSLAATQRVNVYALNIHDCIRLADGTVGYVLSQDYERAIAWVNTLQEVLSFPHSAEVERLLNIEAALANYLHVSNPTQYAYAFLEEIQQ